MLFHLLASSVRQGRRTFVLGGVVAILATLPATAPGSGIPYETYLACPWPTTDLRYRFDGGTEDIFSTIEYQVVIEAMVKWRAVSAVSFRSESTAELSIGWTTQNHRDGYPFDGAYGVLAHAFYPCAPSLPGDVHFDDDETWTTAFRTIWTQPIDLHTTATHELGHALGLLDSGDPDAAMQPYYDGSHRYLGWDDIIAVQALYGHSSGVHHLRNSNTGGAPAFSFRYQSLGDTVVAGDWNGDGTDTIGVYRPAVQEWLLRNTNDEGSANVQFDYGGMTDIPVPGDWDGDGDDTIGVYRPSTQEWYLRNTNSEGSIDHQFDYGGITDLPVSGDWDGDGDDTIGVYRPSTQEWYLRNTNSEGSIDHQFDYGGVSDIPIAGDWDGDGDDTIGVYRPSTATFYLRNSNSEGAVNHTFQFGANAAGSIVANPRATAGDWDGDGTATVGVSQN